jgi:putative tryptophan/tyrosine transport system substrate-binding protein
MRRRDFIAGLGAAVWPLPAGAQQRGIPRVGWLGDVRRSALPDAFRQGMAELGFVEGRDFSVEYRLGERAQYPALAADLVRLRAAVIVAVTSPAALAAKAATRTIPVVFLMGGDPVEDGVVASFNSPGSNLTGVALQAAEVAGKRLEMLHKLVPAAQTIAMLTGPPGVAYVEAEKRELEAAARALGVRLVVVRASTANDIAPAFATLVEQQAGALLIWPSGVLNAAPDQIIALAARHAIPAMFFYSYAVSDGGFASYGPDVNELWHWAGAYTGRILKGEKPADLPVTRPTKFELVINMKTAKALGLTIPETLLATADRVIE